MNAVAKTDAEKWSDYTALQRSIDRLGDDIVEAALYLDRVSRLMPIETMPERRLRDLLDKVNGLSSELSYTLRTVARRRRDADEAAQRVNTLVEAAQAAEVMAEAKRETV